MKTIPLRFCILLAVLVASLLTAPARSADLIVNGGFEEPQIGSGFVQVNAGEATIPGWTVGTGSVYIVKMGTTNQGLDLGDAPGGISQRLVGLIGPATLTCVWICQSTMVDLGVLLNGTGLAPSGNLTPELTTHKLLTGTFTVVGTGDDVLSFRGSHPVEFGPYLDQASIWGVVCGGALPTIVAQSSSTSVAAGRTITFNVSVTGECPMRLQWYRDGEALPGAIESALTIPKVQATDAGDYLLEVSNAVGISASSAVRLRVEGVEWCKGALTVTMQPASTSVLPGQTATFRVGAEGKCPMSFQWYYEGVPISGATGTTLFLDNVQPSLAGTYSVVVRNALGSVNSDSALLAIKAYGAPQVTADEVLLDGPGTVKRADESRVSMTTTFSQGSIFYTTDGSTPSFVSTRYTGRLDIPTSTVIRAIAYSLDFTQQAQAGPFEIVIVPASECYTLTVSVVNPGSATSVLPSWKVYPEGTKVAITAVPGVGGGALLPSLAIPSARVARRGSGKRRKQSHSDDGCGQDDRGGL